MVYTGQTRSRKLIADLSALGFGEIVCPSELPPRRKPWALDNGAFRAWKAGVPFDSDAFVRSLGEMRWSSPDFIVCPDIVAGGMTSLAFSLGWRRRLALVGPLYLAVQDGMEADAVIVALRSFDGLFVGGTLRWKLRTGADWVCVAHAAGKPCHIGRVGTFRRVTWARRINADSIDSCLPLWSRGQLDRFVEGLSSPLHPELFSALARKEEE
jgi:hypothetical protein